MRPFPTRPLHALRRLALFALLVALPAIIVCGHLRAVFGPLHAHDDAIASPTAHHHEGAERHWHLPQDLTVVFLGADAEDPDATGGTKVTPSLPLAPPVQPSLRVARGGGESVPDADTPRWTSTSPEPAERPPRPPSASPATPAA